MTPTFLVRTGTGRYVHAAWMPHGGVKTTSRQDDTHPHQVSSPKVICNRVPSWRVFYLAGPPGALGVRWVLDLCPECERRLHLMAARDEVAPLVGVPS